MQPGGVLADDGPEDPVGKSVLQGGVMAERLGEDRLADPAHGAYRGQGDAALGGVVDQGFKQALEFGRPGHKVQRQRRGGDVGRPVFLRERSGVTGRDGGEQLVQARPVGGGGVERNVLFGFEMDGTIGVLLIRSGGSSLRQREACSGPTRDRGRTGRDRRPAGAPDPGRLGVRRK